MKPPAMSVAKPFAKPLAATALTALAALLVTGFAPTAGHAATRETRRAIPVAPAATGAAPIPAPAATAADDINATARYLAGVRPGGNGTAAQLALVPEWAAHSAEMGEAWQRFDDGRLREIRIWAGRELGGAAPGTVFYPFSGPDFIYAYSYFPFARRYVLCGLEPVGDLPPLSRLKRPGDALGALRQAFGTLLKAGYFVTKNMSSDLRAGELHGTLPLFSVMLARAGCTITGVTAGKGYCRLEFDAPGGGGTRVLEYYTQDISNGGLRGAGGFTRMVQGMGPTVTYIKSASYLPHRDSFSAIRNLILDCSAMIVQDDSGVPVRHFDRNRWMLRLYGAYAPPLDLFKEYGQPDLAALYGSLGGVKPLKFGVGYHWNPKEAILILAVRRGR